LKRKALKRKASLSPVIISSNANTNLGKPKLVRQDKVLKVALFRENGKIEHLTSYLSRTLTISSVRRASAAARQSVRTSRRSLRPHRSPE
jgi:hypothetical protein